MPSSLTDPERCHHCEQPAAFRLWTRDEERDEVVKSVRPVCVDCHDAAIERGENVIVTYTRRDLR